MKKFFEEHTSLVLSVAGIGLLIIAQLVESLLYPIPFIKSNTILNYTTVVIKSVFSSMGIALIVGMITTRIKTSYDLSTTLSNKEKLNYLTTLISSNENTLIDLYKRQIVKDTFNFTSTYRDNVVYEANVYIEGGKVYAKTKMNYTEYRSPKDKKFEEIKTIFDKPNSKILYYKITNPDNVNDNVTISQEDIKERTTKAHGDSMIYEKYCSVPKNLEINRQ